MHVGKEGGRRERAPYRRCLDLSEKAFPEKGLERTDFITLRLWPGTNPQLVIMHAHSSDDKDTGP